MDFWDVSHGFSGQDLNQCTSRAAVRRRVWLPHGGGAACRPGGVDHPGERGATNNGLAAVSGSAVYWFGVFFSQENPLVITSPSWLQ